MVAQAETTNTSTRPAKVRRMQIPAERRDSLSRDQSLRGDQPALPGFAPAQSVGLHIRPAAAGFQVEISGEAHSGVSCFGFSASDVFRLFVSTLAVSALSLGTLGCA